MESQSDLFLQRVYDTGVGVRQWLADGVRDCRRYSGNHPFWLAVYLGWYMCVSTYIYTLCTWPWICYIMIRPGTWWLNDGIAMVQGRRVQKPRDASNFAAAIHSCWWFSWGVRIQTATAENSPGLTSVTPISCNARRFQCEADMDGGRHGGTKP